MSRPALPAFALLATVFLAAAAAAQTALAPDPARLQALIEASWRTTAPEWLARVRQDQTQAECSQYKNQPPAPIAAAILKRERETIKYPDDGKLVGDWKKGAALAQNGAGQRFTDNPANPNGGNCYACHQLDKKELAFGTMGPSLNQWGKNRDFRADAAKEAYDKIYNAQAVFACSTMPRFGHNKFLTPAQIVDLVAYLVDKDSPVNK
jgi:L-cysteine S-thiosulfotransferase